MWAVHFNMGSCYHKQVVCDKQLPLSCSGLFHNWNSMKLLKHAYVYALQNPQFKNKAEDSVIHWKSKGYRVISNSKLFMRIN